MDPEVVENVGEADDADVIAEDPLADYMSRLLDEDEIVAEDLDDGDRFNAYEGESKSPHNFGFGYNIQTNADGSVKVPEKELTKDVIRNGLSHVCRTLDTFEFAYSRYDGRNKNLTDIDVLGEYIHLRVIDLSGNRISNFTPLAAVKHLLVLVLADNQVMSLADIPELPFLQALSVKNNGLTSSAGLFTNSLTYLQLSDNNFEELEGFNSETYAWLVVLELRGNTLKDLKGLDLPKLEKLFVAANGLSSLQGLKGCPNLTHLHARDNKISQLDNFPHLMHLEYVNLRNNILTRFTQTKFLGNSPNIKTLIAMDNPIAALQNYKQEMIATNLNLKRLDKEPVSDVDLVAARELRTGREKGVISPEEDDPSMLTPSMSLNEIVGEGDDDQLGAKEESRKDLPSEDSTYVGELKGVDIKPGKKSI